MVWLKGALLGIGDNSADLVKMAILIVRIAQEKGLASRGQIWRESKPISTQCHFQHYYKTSSSLRVMTKYFVFSFLSI